MTKARDLANAGTALTTVSATELGYLDGVTSAVQTQIDSKIGQATAVNPTIVDAKGDIIAATAADTVARLAVGANDTVLTADSSTATGLKWATPASGGGFTLLSTTSLSAVTTTISSISQSYKHLMIVLRSIYTSGGDSLYFRANGDTGNNYSYSGSYQSYTSFSQYNTSTGNRLPILYAPETTTARRGNAVIWIYNYTLTDYKFISSMGGSGVGSGNIGSTYLNCYHLNSSATDSITLNGNADTVYGTVYIYGVN